MSENQNLCLPNVLVNSLPKSGTHLLLQIILGIPGMKITPAWVIQDKDLDMIKPGYVGPAHLVYSSERALLLKQKNLKVIFISRDLRDVVVSLVHFIMLNKWGNHPWTPYLTSLKTHEERLLTMIKGVNLTNEQQKEYGITEIPNIRQFAQDKLGWCKEFGICSISFEELVIDEESKQEAIMKIIDFLWDDLKLLRISKMELLQKIRGNIKPESSGTFRKGKIGDWKEEFNEIHKEAFKEIAGDILIQLGYEKGDNW
ncbi:sulfotransferase domain-containing protein [Peribacillus frigoritolerans]|uniref:sulfotransferase domain-containing protein n=1 Tax=Peribacillus frigoritolerans TaxID=450367 RepID=UPI0020796931|nr:sulfotransferase domain-containing protein [Peribacillus frigoritolerans]USK62683.1 sulfotransferase domain-containing protein [Peribacillus frigoritolerans]